MGFQTSPRAALQRLCVIALATTLLLLAGLAPAEVGASSTDVAPEPSAGGADEDTDRREALAGLRRGAAERLEGDLKTKFEAMPNDAVVALLQLTDIAQASKDEQAIRAALWKESFESELKYQTGDIPLGEGLATLHLGDEFRYLNEAGTEKLLVEGWGNPPGSKNLGAIVPAQLSPLHETRGWAVIITYSEDGHVDDDDADDIDYDDLLEEMQTDTSAANEQRVAAGYGEVTLKGWATTPHYDSATHRLYWAKELEFSGAAENTLNYAIRVLGRKGVLELNAVAVMSQLNIVQRDMEKILPRAEFETGARYADFDPDIDEVAAYGIGGLIAGKALLKVGFFAGLLKLLFAAKKLILIGIIGFGALAAKLLRRGKDT